MTPRDVDELTSVEYAAFWRYFERENDELKRQQRRNRKGRR